jgi:hypothetical protein
MLIASNAAIKTSRLVTLTLNLLLKENAQRFLDEVLLDFNETLKKKSAAGRKTSKHYRTFSKSYAIRNCSSAPQNIKLKLTGFVRFSEWGSSGFLDSAPTLMGMNMTLTPYSGYELEFIATKVDEAVNKTIEREILTRGA